MSGPDDGDAPAGLGVRLVDRTVVVAAPPERVYALLTHADGIVRWMAPQAQVEAVVDGVIAWRHANGDRVEGRFVELVPARRVVFTYGWDRQDVGIPVGSTLVEITLTPLPSADGTGTELHLVHRGLSEPMARAHHGGWANYLARLTAVAEGRDPGPDPLAAERVPAAGQRVEP
ncbi:SRPBCC domain-containing protein [Kineosporia sp. R_H_3]|uniref:SRPBCC family protein n=1 Tax=Kineosporia sp. R_H_3 TaxID=1961848 RepID=UPI0018E95956|nr:SRPBCC domain-containing protein [Kineosporia sp. R_H_3]